MPQTKQIIFLLDRSGSFKLRDDIKSFGFDEKLGQYYVKFNKGNHYLHYNPEKVDVAEFIGQLEPPFRITQVFNGVVFHHILGVRVFQGRFNRAYRIIFENGEALVDEFIVALERTDEVGILGTAPVAFDFMTDQLHKAGK